MQDPHAGRRKLGTLMPPPYVPLADSAQAGTLPLRGPLRALVATMRPKQWIKNALVIAAPGAAGALGHDGVPIRVALATAAFCLLASGIYAVNDARDAPEDRLHPLKRLRPVAAGDLDARTAIRFGIWLIVLGIAICAAVSLLLALVAVAYVAMTVSYTLVWRHTRVLDIGAIAGGFVLRAIAGGAAAPVTLSRSFLLVVAYEGKSSILSLSEIRPGRTMSDAYREILARSLMTSKAGPSPARVSEPT